MTSWTHKPTGTVIERATIEALVRTQWDNPRPHARKAARRQLLTIGVQLTEIITELEKKLERGYDILNVSPDDAKEERWLGWLASYEAAYDARSLIAYRVVEDRPELITERRAA